MTTLNQNKKSIQITELANTETLSIGDMLCWVCLVFVGGAPAAPAPGTAGAPAAQQQVVPKAPAAGFVN